MQRVPSGMPNLDRLLGGGLPVVPDIVVSGSEDDVFLFSQHLLWNRVNAGDICLYGTLSRTREDVLTALVSKEWDVSPFLNEGTLKIVDFLSLADTEPETTDEKLEALFSISQEALVPDRFYRVLTREFYSLKRAKPLSRFIAMLDSLDKLIMTMGSENTLRFEKMVFNLLKDNYDMGVGFLYNQFVSQEALEAVRTTASVFIELKQERGEKETRQMVRVTKTSAPIGHLCSN